MFNYPIIKLKNLNFKTFYKKGISLNFIYYSVSLLIIGFLFFYFNFYLTNQSLISSKNPYSSSVVELSAFVICFIISVYLQNLKENIFLKILIFFCFVFFILRIPFSILSFENSILFVRNVDSFQLNNSILVLITQYSILFFTIYIFNPRLNSDKNLINLSFVNFTITFLILLIFSNLLFNLFGEIGYESGKKFLTVFFNIFNSLRVCLIFTIIVFIILRKKYKIKNIYLKIFLFYVFFLLDTSLSGSRSGLFFVVLTLFILILYYLNVKIIKLKYLLLSLILFLFLYLSFAVTTSFKTYSTYKNVDKYLIAEKIAILENISKKNALEKMQSDKEWLKNFFIINFFNHFQAITERIGYLDFYIEKQSNYEKYYKNKINLNYYYKPVLDRLSPGIDLFNVPFATKIIQEEYFKKMYKEKNIQKEFVTLVTNSEQITTFAETESLFGKFSVLYYLFVVILIKFFLHVIAKFNIFLKEISFGVLLITFFDWLTGFGIDTFVVLTVYQFILVFIIYVLNKLYFLFENK